MNKTMKKTYKTPTMKVVEVQQTQMLCGSMLGITREEVDEVETESLYGAEYNKGAW